MAQIYGELIRAQLQASTTNLSSPVVGLVYFNNNTLSPEGLKWYTGSEWKVAVDLNSTQTLASKVIDGTCSINASALPSLIDATKIADGSVDNTAFQKLFTVGTDAAGELVNTDGTQTLTNKTLGTGCSFDPSALPLTPPSKGGTGVANNDLSTLTIAGSFPVSFTISNSTALTLPNVGTLATLAGSENLLNKSISSTAGLNGALKLPLGTTAERPTSPVVTEGMIRYNTDLSSFEGRSGGVWSSIGGGGTTDRITQVGHGFNVGDVLYLNGSTYTKAIATSAAAAEVVGVVSRNIDTDTFEITLSGEVTGLTGLTAGEVYFLSAATAGLLTTTEPTVVGQVSVPVGVASSATSLYVAPKRGSVVGSSNARTQIALANNATTTVQNIAAYDAGELTGWVSITATTPLRFYVAAQFSKNGASNNFNVSYQVSGDTPPTGFVVTATAAGLLQITLPSITGFASASINYALNAPAIGTSFPLTISARNVVGDTSGTAVPTGYVGEKISASPASPTSAAASNSWANLCSITLTPGVWLINGTAVFTAIGATYTRVGSGISLTSGNIDISTNSAIAIIDSSQSTANTYVNCGQRYLSVSANTTVYLVGLAVYSVIGTSTWNAVSNLQAVRIA